MSASFVIAFTVTLIYGSFLEWFVHRVGMHTQKLSKWAFKRHAIQHHTESRSLKSFYHPNQRYHIVESSSVPFLWIAHLPVYIAVWIGVNPAASCGIMTAAFLYMAAYEVIHFFIHTPRNYRWQRSRVWSWYCEYHRYHHHRARWNYNVVCPLADYVIGTFCLDDLPVEKSAPDGFPVLTGPKSIFRPVAPKQIAGDFSLEPDASLNDG